MSLDIYIVKVADKEQLWYEDHKDSRNILLHC